MIIIGSKAILHWFPDFPREAKDTDVVELHNTEFWSDSENRVDHHVMPFLFDFQKEGYLDKDLLYTLKISHLFWDIKWSKHMFDVVHLKERGCKFVPEFFKIAYTYWQNYHGKVKKSNLTLSKEEFFDNALKEYDHDFLHTLIKDKPTYFKVLKDGEEVEPDENKFNALSFQEKLDLVREEVYIMAFERFNHLYYKEAYHKMLKKFIMHHAPMWEALFIIENYLSLRLPEYNFITLIQNKLENV